MEKTGTSIPICHSDAEMMVNGIVSFGTATAAEYNENRANYFETQKVLMMNGSTWKILPARSVGAASGIRTPVVGGGGLDLWTSFQIQASCTYVCSGTDPKSTKDFLEQWMETLSGPASKI